MNRESIGKFKGHKNITVVDAMELIDENVSGALFVVDDDESLIGAVSDGDIRRWILRSGDLKAPVTEIMNSSPVYIFEGQEASAESMMREKSIRIIPVVDSLMRIVNVIRLSDISDSHQGVNPVALKEVPVIIMAGGKGTRLYPYTKILPKPLIPIGDTPIVERIINRFTEYGVDNFYMTVNYKKGMIKTYFNDLNPAYSIVYVEEDKPLGTGGSIRLIKETFDRPVIVINCDTLIVTDYEALYEHHKISGNDITVVSALKKMTIPYGVIHSGENGEIEHMEEKPKLSYFINTGMYVINPEMINLIPENEMFHMTHLIDKVISAGGKVGTFPISEDSFLDMGEFGEMRRMEEKLNIASEET